MVSSRLHQQFIRLWKCCQGESQSVTLDQLSILLGCSRRHMRSLLNAMQQQGWLSWQAQAGRGKRSLLNFHYSGIASQQQQVTELLALDKLELLRQQLGETDFTRLLLARTGYWRQSQLTGLRLLSRHSMENLLPGQTRLPVRQHVLHQLFSGLLRLNPQTGELLPDVAYHWQQLTLQHWRFYLRTQVRFHHGRILDQQDVLHSLERLRQLPQGAHLDEVIAGEHGCLDVHLSQPDCWLPWLLSSDYALILPQEWQSLAHFSRYPVGSGPYQVFRHTPSALTLRAFDGYFGYRALTEQISIWQSYQAVFDKADDHLPACSDWPWCVACHYLLFDSRTRCGKDAHCRAWLSQVLTPKALQEQLPASSYQDWCSANSLLPLQTSEHTDKTRVTKPGGLHKLRLAFRADQEDFSLISQGLVRLLAAHQVELECQPVDEVTHWHGDLASDLWLNEHYFTAPLAFSLFFRLWQTPLVQKCLPRDWLDDSRRWQSGSLTSADWIQQCQRQSQLLPLFHHRKFPQHWNKFSANWFTLD